MHHVSHQHIDCCCLASSIMPQQREQLVVVDSIRNAVHRPQFPFVERFCQPQHFYRHVSLAPIVVPDGLCFFQHHGVVVVLFQTFQINFGTVRLGGFVYFFDQTTKTTTQRRSFAVTVFGGAT